MICFEWLQRPENVLAGYVRWSPWARAPRYGLNITRPLEEVIDGEPVHFSADAEAILAQVPRVGVPMILKRKRDGAAEPYNAMTMGRSCGRYVGWPACRIGSPWTVAAAVA